ncbi:hypothetical protein NEOC95_001972 [Neochlamydia sp. AcF95]|nr:hypothetical protein [Neochlamydia sp. AcF95]
MLLPSFLASHNLSLMVIALNFQLRISLLSIYKFKKKNSM